MSWPCFRHHIADKSPYADFRGNATCRCRDFKLIEIIEIKFLVLAIAISAAKHVQFVVYLGEGRVKSAVSLVLVGSFALCPVSSFDAIKMKCVVDLDVVDVDPTVKQQPVFIDAEQAGWISGCWNLSSILEFIHFQSLQVESPKVVVAAKIVVGASEHKPSAPIECAAVATHHLQVFAIAFQPYLFPLIGRKTKPINIQRIVKRLIEGNGGAAVEIECVLVDESLMFESGFGSVGSGVCLVQHFPL